MRFHFSWSNVITFIGVVTLAKSVSSQNTLLSVEEYPFVTVEDSTANIDNNTNKIFSTTLRVSLRNATAYLYSEEIILNAVNSFYGQRVGFNGFQETSNFMAIRDPTNEYYTISYDSTYNFLQLQASIANASGQAIFGSIGSLPSVRTGLEADPNFRATFTVSAISSTYTFSGNSLCDDAGCPQGQYTHCIETTTTLVTQCRSLCKVGYCQNSGWCIHYDGNTAPQCSCPSTFDTWYVGTHCELYLHLWMPCVFGAAVVLILISIPIIACCLPLKSKQKKKVTIVDPKEEYVITVHKPDLAPRKSAKSKGSDTEVISNLTVKLAENEKNMSEDGYQDDAKSSDHIPSSSEDNLDNDYDAVLTHRYETPEPAGNLICNEDVALPENNHVPTVTYEDVELNDSEQSSEEEESSGEEFVIGSSLSSFEVEEPTSVDRGLEEVDHHPPIYAKVMKKLSQPQVMICHDKCLISLYQIVFDL
ncbi:uncharacterized protein LOC143449315 isoform X2 [Clavelina lepadiformis]|uniref:uncharacterized protein LOC143449315 isoform X2 n=1 Tax=Clavelina lepadiformis TaxID=159417 RepID=UPI004040EEC4